MANPSDGSIIIDTGLDNTGLEKGSDKLLAKIEEVVAAINKVGTSSVQGFGQANQILAQILPLVQTIATTMQSGMAPAMGQTAEQAAKVAEAEQNVVTEAAKVVESERQVATEASKAAEAERQVTTEAAKATKAVSSDKSAASMKRLETQIESARAKLAAYYAEKERIEASTDEMLPFAYTDEQTKNVLEMERIELEKLDARYAKQIASLQALEAEYEKLKAAKEAAAKPVPEPEPEPTPNPEPEPEPDPDPAPDVPPKTQSNWEAFRKKVNDVLKKFGSNVWKNFKSTLKGIGTAAAGAAKGLLGLTKQTKSGSINLNGLVKTLTSFKTLLLSRIKRTFISAVIRDVSDSLNKLTQFSSEFDGVMSRIKNGSKELGANLAVSLGNVITAIEPLVTTLLNGLSRGITYLNSFMAMMTGKSTVIVAKKQMGSYAESIDDAAKSQKELNAQVYGFDELNRRQKDTSKDSDGTSAADLFEEKPIENVVPSGLLEALQAIKDDIMNGRWEDAGKKVAGGLNTIVSTVDDWINSVRPKAVQWSENIARFLNGLVDGFNGYNLGKTLADGLNLALDVANTFLTTFNFTTLGQLIGNGINGIFENVEFDLLGQTLANKFNAVVDTLYGIVTTIRWGMIGDQLATGIQNLADTANFDRLGEAVGIGVNGVLTAINHLIDGVNWGGIASSLAHGVQTLISTFNINLLADAISGAVNAIIEILSNFGAGIDWAGAAADIAHGLNKMISDIDWAGAGKLLGDAVIGLLDIITVAIEEIDWQQVGKKTAECVSGISWSGVTESLFGGIGAALGGLSAFLVGLFKGPWEDLVAWWHETAYKDGEFTMQGLLDGIWQKVKDIGAWIKEHIFDPFINGFRKAFGINSPSTVMAEQGKYLIEGLKQGITEKWTSITSFFTQTLPQLANTISQKWDSIKATATQKWSDIKTSVTSKWSELKNTLTNTDFRSVGSNLVSGIKQGIESTWNTLKQTATNLKDKLVGWLEEKFDINSPSRVMRDRIGVMISRGLAVGITDGSRDIIKSADNMTSGLNNRILSGLSGLSFGNIGIPDIATGSVIPYKVAASSLPATEAESEVAVLRRDLDEYMDEQGYVLKQILDLLRKLNLTIDAESLSDLIGAIMTNRERGFGM